MRDLLTYYWVKKGQPQSRLDFNNVLIASKAPRSDQYQLSFHIKRIQNSTCYELI